MNPSDAHSSLTALRQLKEMLDTGTITSTEFETLKRQIVFGLEPALPLEPPMPAATEPLGLPPVTASPPLGAAEMPAAYVLEEKKEAFTESVPPGSLPAETEWLATNDPSLQFEDDVDDDEADTVPPLEEERRNPLNLVFALGGLLVFLGVIAYLMLGRPTTPNEHLTSTSQTAADSTSTAPEVGPQAEQLNLPPAAAPETIRVAPVNQPVPTQAANQFQVDSATTSAPAAPVKKAAVPPPAPTASPVATDSASTAP